MIDPSPDITALRQNIHARLDDLNARMVGAAVWLLDDRRRLTRLEAVVCALVVVDVLRWLVELAR